MWTTWVQSCKTDQQQNKHKNRKRNYKISLKLSPFYIISIQSSTSPLLICTVVCLQWWGWVRPLLTPQTWQNKETRKQKKKKWCVPRQMVHTTCLCTHHYTLNILVHTTTHLIYLGIHHYTCFIPWLSNAQLHYKKRWALCTFFSITQILLNLQSWNLQCM